MVFNDILKQFIFDLSVDDNTVKVMPHAFLKLGEQYQIGEIKAFLLICDEQSQVGERREEVVLFDQALEKQEEVSFRLEYLVRQKEKIVFEVYRLAGALDFSQEEKENVKMLVDIIHMHYMKWRILRREHDMKNVDRLTGLPNSNGYLQAVRQLIQKGELTQYNAYHINLERFGMINRRFGVRETDYILARYAMKLAEFLLEDECLGRLGGDNFVAIIRKERTEAFLEFIAGVHTYGVLEGNQKPLVIGAVAGILELDESISDEAPIINDCTVALNEARHIQKKPYLYVTKELKEAVLGRKVMVAAFPKALQNGEFQTFYQPKVCLDDYTIVGAEALVKWQQEEKLLNPGEFVPAFEQNGMVCMLDFYVLEQVCKDIRQWVDAGIEPVRISVNFSRKHLSNPNLAEDIMDVIHKYEIDSKYIEIELTETVDEDESGLLADFMDRMRKYDIRMTIDDFGTGYASLNMLRTFPVDVLKIDKSLVDNMEKNDQIILSSVVKMASDLEMDVVAEGVETWEQVDYLKEVNCGVVQGFLFDKPMPKNQFTKKMKQKKYDVD